MPASLPSPPESAVPHVRVDITDELDLAGLPEVAHVMDRILALRPRELTIDLAGCRHVDAAAVALLLDVHRRLARQGGLLTLSSPTPPPPPPAGRRAPGPGSRPHHAEEEW